MLGLDVHDWSQAYKHGNLRPGMVLTVEPGLLLLLDAGVEAHTLRSADITRTLPISGKFTGPQRAIYELVSAEPPSCRRARGSTG